MEFGSWELDSELTFQRSNFMRDPLRIPSAFDGHDDGGGAERFGTGMAAGGKVGAPQRDIGERVGHLAADGVEDLGSGYVGAGRNRVERG